MSLDNADTVIEGGPLLRLMKWSGCPISRVRCEKWGLFSSGLLPRCRTPVCCKTCEPSGDPADEAAVLSSNARMKMIDNPQPIANNNHTTIAMI